MKTDHTDPPRFEEQGPDALRELVHFVRQRGPSDDAAERISKRLAMASVPTASPARRVPVVEHKIAHHKFGLVALAVAGALAFGWQATDASSSTSAGAPSAPLGAEPSAVALATIPRSEFVVSKQGPTTETAAISIGDLPSVAPSSARAPGAAPVIGGASGAASTMGGMKGKTSTDSAGSMPSATELEIMQRAQAALTSDPHRALALANEHARSYPSGELVQERELIAVEALSRIGRKEEALRRAHSLIERFPRTPYVARLELAIGRSLTSPGASRN